MHLNYNDKAHAMSAYDTFEWYVTTMINNQSEDIQQYIKSQREYLFTLRSEDERQRFVDEVIEEFRSRGAAKPPHHPMK